MTSAEFAAAIAAVEAVVNGAPSLAEAVGNLFHAHAQNADPSHAQRQVAGQAALAFLGIKDGK